MNDFVELMGFGECSVFKMLSGLVVFVTSYPKGGECIVFGSKEEGRGGVCFRGVCVAKL